MIQELDKINNRTNTITILFHRHKKLDNCVICYYKIWKLKIWNSYINSICVRIKGPISLIQTFIDTVLKKCVSSKVLIFVVNKKINKEQWSLQENKDRN